MEKIRGINISSSKSVENNESNLLYPITEAFIKEFERILCSGNELYMYNGVIYDKKSSEEELQKINIKLGSFKRGC